MASERTRIAGISAGGRTECKNCGAFVTKQFARVFGDNRNRVHACIECSTLASLREQAGIIE